MTKRWMLFVGLSPIALAVVYACESSDGVQVASDADTPDDASHAADDAVDARDGDDVRPQDGSLLGDGGGAEDAIEVEAHDAVAVECCPLYAPAFCGCGEVGFGGSPDGGVCAKTGTCDNRFDFGTDSRVDPNGCPYIQWSDFRSCFDTGVDTARETGVDAAGE